MKTPHERDLPCEFYDWEDSKESHWRYTRCAHWFWQTEASPHLWTPEIYESFTTPITITRFIPVKCFEGVPGGKPTYADARHLLHFDFVVTTRLRELGGKLKNPFSRHSSKPAEIRVKNDFGYPLKRDRVTFCLYSCPNAEAVIWPRTPTIDQQEIANALV